MPQVQLQGQCPCLQRLRLVLPTVLWSVLRLLRVLPVSQRSVWGTLCDPVSSGELQRGGRLSRLPPILPLLLGIVPGRLHFLSPRSLSAQRLLQDTLWGGAVPQLHHRGLRQMQCGLSALHL